MLIEGLRKNGYANILGDLEFNRNGKPFFKNDIGFNLSHSDALVICAITGTGGNSIGIDIEKIRAIDFESFPREMTDGEWKGIHQSDDPSRSFLSVWTSKESVIKADGRGLLIESRDIQVDGHRATYHDKRFYITPLRIDDGYCACLASPGPAPDLVFTEMDFYKQ